ncbi:hypothetical protein EHI47_07275 [Rhizobium leguminosarum]|uniref:Uncharacterized protein n=1 Tax=Rhizobium leguminosarum TaxID=384 RepID=A0A444I7K3_RHILE|nr:hypothetical protein [Rhizobium leguminosarum]MBY5814519.1 hypothetical protein [Rhizobium leguminosarum]RWX34192.1 hypothetical protein EHI47_07275 [Rhizobium leguminosarum]
MPRSVLPSYGGPRSAGVRALRLLRAANDNLRISPAIAVAGRRFPEFGPFDATAVSRHPLRPFGLSAILIAVIAVDIVAFTMIASTATRLLTIAIPG